MPIARWDLKKADDEISDSTNRKRWCRGGYQARVARVTRQGTGKPNSQSDIAQVNPAAFEGSSSVLPWEIFASLQIIGAGQRRRRSMGVEKSAEAIVAQRTG